MTVYRTNDPDRWGNIGKGSPLTSEEGDRNLWDLDQRIKALEDAVAPVTGISNIEVIGSQMIIYLSDGTTYGPFTLPIAAFRFRGEFVDNIAYLKNDLISVKQRGLFLVLLSHTSTAPFDPAATDDDGNALYLKVFGEDTYVYDIGFFYPGKPGQGIAVGGNLAEHIFARAAFLPAILTGSLAKLDVSCAANLVLPIKKNGTQIGTLTFPAGTKVGQFVFTVVEDKPFAIGDVLGLGRPTVIDATALGLSATFVANIPTS